MGTEDDPVELPVGGPEAGPVKYPPGKHPNQIKHHKKGKAAVEEARAKAAQAAEAAKAERDAQAAAMPTDIDFDAPEVLKAMNRVMLTEEAADRTPLQRSLRKLYDNDFAKFMDLYNRREAAEEKRLVALGPAAVEGPDPGTQKARALINELLDSFYKKHPEMKRP